jgi:hypothetical protein
MRPEVQAAVDLIKSLPHRDEEYVGDHWATGRCQRCLAEIALGARDPAYGGLSLEENRRFREMANREELPGVIG